jgi:hypothetical protein
MWMGLCVIALSSTIWGFLMSCPILPEKLRDIGIMAIFLGMTLFFLITIAYGINLILTTN